MKSSPTSSQEDAIIVFKEQTIRRTWYQDAWWFSVVDVCTVLAESADGGAYWRKLKQRLRKEGSEVVTNCHGLKLLAPDGKKYTTDCADTESMFRLIQSIPSPKAEPFKGWLAKVGYERIQEIENPELAQKRMKHLYEQKGYPKDWIDKRLRGIAIRQNLTDEWQERGINHQKDYAILTAEISKATFEIKLIEGRKPNFHVSAFVADATATKADYIHTRAQDNAYYQKLIVDYLKNFKSATRKEIDKLLWSKLSDALDNTQKQRKINNLLTHMHNNDMIQNIGSRKSSIWKLQSSKNKLVINT